MASQIYNLSPTELVNYYDGCRCIHIESKNSFTFCSKLNFEGIVIDYCVFHYIKPITEIYTILPNTCWLNNNEQLLILFPSTVSLSLNKYHFNCELILFNSRPILICRNYTLLKLTKSDLNNDILSEDSNEYFE